MASTPALPETPLDAVRTVGLFPSFTPPVVSTLPASQQHQVTAARHSRASWGGFANAQNRGPSTGPSTSIPSRKGKHIAPPTVIKCAIIPFAVKNGAHSESLSPPNMFKFDAYQRGQLLAQLMKWGLVFVFAYQDESVAVWESLDQQVTNHLQRHGISIQCLPIPGGHPYLNISWTLCIVGRGGKNGANNYISSTPSEYDWTFAHIQHIAWADPIEQGCSVFFVAPRFGNLQGPLPSHGDPKLHPCWPWRVVSECHTWLGFGTGKAIDVQPNVCIPECEGHPGTSNKKVTSTSRRTARSRQHDPDPVSDVDSDSDSEDISMSPPLGGTASRAHDDGEYVPTARSTRKRTLSPSANTWPHQRIRTEDPSNCNLLSSTAAAPSQPLFARSPSPDLKILPPKCAPRMAQPTLCDSLKENDITKWQDDIRNLPKVMEAPDASMKGHSAASLARFLLKTLDCLAQAKPTPTQDGQGKLRVNGQIPNIYSLLVDFPRFDLDQALGNGVIRTVYRLALGGRVATNRWRHSAATDGHCFLYLSPNPDLEVNKKSTEYQVDGLMAALYMTYHAIGPEPISPFVLLAASIESIDQFYFDIDFARATIPDQDTLRNVVEILQLQANDTVALSDKSKSSLFSHAEQIGLNLTDLTRPQPLLMHALMKKQMLASILVGHHNPWQHPNFIAFKEGFNCVEGRALIEIPDLHLNGNRYLQRFLSTVYNRRIENPADVIPLIHWEVEVEEDELGSILCRLFIVRLVRWMSGTGHPCLMLEQGQVAQDLYDRDERDHGLRARLFYQTSSGSDLRMMGYKQHITVCLAYRPHFQDMNTVKFSVCTNTVYVDINDAIANLLVQPGKLDLVVDGDEVWSKFDIWWHAQMIAHGEEFNTV